MAVVKNSNKTKLNTLLSKIKHNPDLLKQQSLTILQELYKLYHPRKSSPKTKLVLIIELSYIIQSNAYGVLDKTTIQALRQAQAKSIKSQHAKDPTTNTSNPRPKHTLTLEHGTNLKRIFNGREHQVQISITGNKQVYLYNNTTYNSLSKIARLITGTHLSGPRFFGLTNNTNNNSKSITNNEFKQ
jgi:hypothetical protein